MTTKMENMPRDFVDAALEEWASEQPELDLAAAAVVNRIRRAAALIEERLSLVIGRSGIRNPGDLDTLVALRGVGAPYELSPKELTARLLVTSAGLSGRLDRLEASGWLERRPHPTDRRAAIVSLTQGGKHLVDGVFGQALDLYHEALFRVDEADRKQLADLLRVVLIDLGDA